MPLSRGPCPCVCFGVRVVLVSATQARRAEPSCSILPRSRGACFSDCWPGCASGYAAGPPSHGTLRVPGLGKLAVFWLHFRVLSS